MISQGLTKQSVASGCVFCLDEPHTTPDLKAVHTLLDIHQMALIPTRVFSFRKRVERG